MTARSAHPWRVLPDHDAEGVGQGAGDQQDQEDLQVMLESGVGFSKGWAELALKKPPPLVPNSLIASWEATGPMGMVTSLAVTLSVTGFPLASLSGFPLSSSLGLS